MARAHRLDGEGIIHHVTARGVERRWIFGDTADHLAFVDRLGRLLVELRFLCLAWALIPNHFHLLVKRNGAPLSKLMARLNGPYAQSFNRRHARVGHLFQDRFVSRVIESEADLANVARYVLFNPVRHGVVPPRQLARYPWCGFGAVVRARAPHPFESVRETLRIFDANESVARSHLDRELIRLAPELSASDRLEKIVRDACLSSGVPRSLIGSRGSAATSVRDRVCAIATGTLGIRPAEIARVLGISRTAVHQSVARSAGTLKTTGV